MNLLVGVTGRAGVGKSTFIGAADSMNGFRALYPGRICRSRWGAAAFATSDNPAAPGFSEAFVRGLVADASAGEEEIILVDGFPRTADQVRVLPEIAISHGRVPLILVLEVPQGVLSLRLQSRDAAGTDEATLNIRRVATDFMLPDMLVAVAKLAHVQTVRLSNAMPGLEKYRGRAVALLSGLLNDARADDGSFSVFHTLAGVS